MALLAFELPRIRTTGFLCLALDILGSFTVVSAQLGRKFDLDPISNFCSKWCKWHFSSQHRSTLRTMGSIRTWIQPQVSKALRGTAKAVSEIPKRFLGMTLHCSVWLCQFRWYGPSSDVRFIYTRGWAQYRMQRYSSGSQYLSRR